MASRSILNTILFLRIFTLLALAASVVVMVLNKAKDVDGSKATFCDAIGYRYVVAVGGMGVIYTLVQIPFAIYNVAQEKRWIRNGFLQEFDFYGDKLIAFLLATEVGVGFGISFEFQRFFYPIGRTTMMKPDLHAMKIKSRLMLILQKSYLILIRSGFLWWILMLVCSPLIMT